eukprot:TRINITY_DN55628_c0_g1_i1.p1 TRINITY_DN55628_c0_g1~~TRINITY_DN55628_c0_g1_i1.p1  ORF type:complete len:564 (+),score=95.63 TRINITY_DN55628_c0_g1_i1:86-1777(+)
MATPLAQQALGMVTAMPAIETTSSRCVSQSTVIGLDNVVVAGCGALSSPIGISWALADGGRAALAGPRGVGKTAQLQVLLGELTPSVGSAVFGADIRRLGVLRRGFAEDAVARAMAAADPSNRTLEASLKCRPEMLRRRGDSPSCCESSEFPAFDIVEVSASSEKEPTLAVDVGAVLSALCLTEFAHYEISSLTDLCQVRFAAALLAVHRPDVLLLDDATEGLDEEAIASIESFVASPPMEPFRAVLVASHDRDLMDKLCNQVIDVAPGKVEVHQSNYTGYLAGGDFLRFSDFTLYQPKAIGLRATQAACAFASIFARSQGDCSGRSLRLVDAGTGTGVLALLAAQEWNRIGGGAMENFTAWAVDVDRLAIEVASGNIASSPWSDRISTVCEPFESWLGPSDGLVDVCICNPPYNHASTVARTGSDEVQLTRRRARERDFLPLAAVGDAAVRLGCRELWVLWGAADDEPVLAAAAASGWSPSSCSRFRRTGNSKRSVFASAWRFLPAATRGGVLPLEESCVKEEEVLWYDDDGAPSDVWNKLVGSLYYWRVRHLRREFCAQPG